MVVEAMAAEEEVVVGYASVAEVAGSSSPTGLLLDKVIVHASTHPKKVHLKASTV